MNAQEPRYVIRQAATSTFRDWEIFDNLKRETIGSFKGKSDTGGAAASTYAEELVKRLNAENELDLAARDARQQLWNAITRLSDEAAVRQLADYEKGRGLYLPKPETEDAEATS